MKIALISDMHLGYSDDALPQAKMALELALQLADAVVTCGDIFDLRVPRQETIHESLALFKEYSEKFQEKNAGKVKITKKDSLLNGQPVIGIPGTHERRTKGMVNAIDVLDAAGLMANCHNTTCWIEGKNENGEVEKIAVSGIAGVPEEFAAQIFQTAGIKPAQGATHNVFIFHQTLREVIPMAKDSMAVADLPKGFDLYVDGHIHWRRELQETQNDNNITVLLPGSTVITQMKKNETEKKGIYVYDTTSKQYSFHHFDSRPFYFIETTVENATIQQVSEEARAKLRETIDQHKKTFPTDTRKPLIKLKIWGTLAKGITSDVFEATSIAEEVRQDAEAYIDKHFETSDDLRDKIELLRRLKAEQKSASEMGLAILKKRLNELDYKLGNEEELFSLLSEGEVEKALTLVTKNNN